MDEHDPYPHVYVRTVGASFYVLKFDHPEHITKATVLRLDDKTCDECFMDWREPQMEHSTYERIGRIKQEV